MASKYPNPCNSCKTDEICRIYRTCARYRAWLNWNWATARGYAYRRLHQKPKETTKFFYEHPDHIRRYLIDGPCKGCPAEATCDMPCPAYLRWYDARMQITRKKVGV